MNCYFWWKKPVELCWLLAEVNDAVHDLFEIEKERVSFHAKRSHSWRGETHFYYNSFDEFQIHIPPGVYEQLSVLVVNYDWAPAHSHNSFFFVIDGNDIQKCKVRRCYFGHSMEMWLGYGGVPEVVVGLSRLYKACREMMYRLGADRVAHCRFTDWAGQGIESEDIDADFMFQPSGRQLLNPRLEEGVNPAWLMNDTWEGRNLFDNVEIHVDPSEVEWYRKGGLTAPWDR